MNNADKKIDFFIPLHRNHPLFQSCIESIVAFYHPLTIYIATSKKVIDELEKCVSTWDTKTTILSFINEETFFQKSYGPEFSKEKIEEKWYTYKDEKSREFGWWYQQILKLGVVKRLPEISDPFIVWDSDLVPIKKWPILPCEAVPFFQFALLQEKEKSAFNKEQYQASLEHLLLLPEIVPPDPKGTFVPHHFVFHHKVIREFITRVERIHNTYPITPFDFFTTLKNEISLFLSSISTPFGSNDQSRKNTNVSKKTWIEIIVSLSKDYYRFSEYKNIATFMSHYYPELLFYHPYQKYGEKGIRIREEEDALGFIKKIRETLGKPDISYVDFCQFVQTYYDKEVPSYIQVEHL
jgi:hypothetical protein